MNIEDSARNIATRILGTAEEDFECPVCKEGVETGDNCACVQLLNHWTGPMCIKCWSLFLDKFRSWSERDRGLPTHGPEYFAGVN